MNPKRRLFDVVSDVAYLEGLASWPLEELRARRDECRELENEISFERRLCHARIDILRAEVARREGKEESDLVARLPEILSRDGGGVHGHLPERAPDLSIPRTADVPRRRVEEIAGERTLAQLSKLSTEEVGSIVDNLVEHEADLSARRRKVHEVIDEIEGEIVKRYRSGEADPANAIN